MDAFLLCETELYIGGAGELECVGPWVQVSENTHMATDFHDLLGYKNFVEYKWLVRLS
jgi:hypothetical protein